MRAILRLAFVLGLALAAGPAGSVEWGEDVVEPAWDWRPGDLIFRNGVNAFDDRLQQAAGLKWASVGILRSSSAGPRVVYAGAQAGVTEVTLDGFVAGLASEDYEVYRAEALIGGDDPSGGPVQGPLARYALLSAYGAPFDPHFLFGNGRFYNAELPFEAAMTAGVELGGPVSLARWSSGNEALRAALLDAAREHPFCVVAASSDECWDEIASLAVVTTDTIRASALLHRVFPQ